MIHIVPHLIHVVYKTQYQFFFSENKLFVAMTDNVLNSYGNTFYLCQCKLHGKVQCVI